MMKAVLPIFLLFLGLIGFSTQSSGQQNAIKIQANDSPELIIYKAAHIVPSARQLHWQQLELTAFLHFGINTFTNSEWGNGKEYPQCFNPDQMDARQWIRTLKKAGFRQVILTAKHHDGFCLWPSKYTEHSVKHSPWRAGQGDVVKEVANACHQQGLGFGLYLSPWDRNSPLYGTSAYNDYFNNQLTELLTQYGQVDEVWFDGACGEGPNGKKQEYDFNRWFNTIRRLQPKAVIAITGPDVRWVGTESGHGRETEWSVVPIDALDPAWIAGVSQQTEAFKPQGDMTADDLGSRQKILQAKALAWYPAETDVSIRPGWFFHPEETGKIKSVAELIEIYFHSVGRNGVLLLNIPPDTHGRIGVADADTLLAFRKQLQQRFKHNLLRSADFGRKAGLSITLTDGNITTAIECDSGTVLEFQWKKKQKVGTILLQEDISQGQRAEGFVLESFDQGQWQLVAKGTTIGYKRLLQFQPVHTSHMRLRLTAVRFQARLGEIGLYAE